MHSGAGHKGCGQDLLEFICLSYICIYDIYLMCWFLSILMVLRCIAQNVIPKYFLAKHGTKEAQAF